MSENETGWMLLPPAPGACEECAMTHPPDTPHNPQSLFYQTKFNLEHGRAATWGDAWAHCEPNMIDLWHGLVNERYAAHNMGRIDREGRLL